MIYTTARLLASSGMAARSQSVPSPVSSTAPMPNAKKKAENQKGDTRRAPGLFTATSTDATDGAYENSMGKPLFEHLLVDQKAIWTSPSRLRFADTDWLLPLGALAGGLL